jgi:hypothetical protein
MRGASTRVADGERLSAPRRGTLVAVLLNPPAATSGARTHNAVTRAGHVLGYASVEIVNLCGEATRSVVDLNASTTADRWVQARADLSTALDRASALLGAWGVAGLVGTARRHRDEQVAWLRQEATRLDLSNMWMVGGEPRHPSRWHQYVSDKYGRTAGGTSDERLQQVLRSVPLFAEK